MAYPPSFLAALQAEVQHLRFLLESVPIGEIGAFEGSLKLSSFDAPGYVHAISRRQSSITYGTLRPGSWSTSYGQLRIGILPDVDVGQFIAPGQCVALRVGLEGYDIDDFVTVWLGVVRNHTWHADHWVLECAELTAALTNRLTSNVDEVLLFSGLSSSTLDGGFDPDVDADFDVANGSIFEKSSEAGDAYCLLITPSSGNPYFVLADTRSTNTFSDITVGSPFLGTFPVEADDEDTVAECAYTETHPIRAALRVLMSTGTAGTNGEHDVLPRRWGYGIQPEYIDVADSEYFRTRLAPATGTTQWQMIVVEEQQDGLGWLSGWLAGGGFYVCQRQGKLTVRGVRSPYYDVTAVDAAWITDDHIVPGTITYYRWDPDSPIEYSFSIASGGTGSGSFAGTRIESRPVRYSITRVMAGSYGSTSAWGVEVTARLGPFDVRRPERLELQTAGLGMAGVTMGDLVRVESAYLPSARARNDEGNRRWLVVGGGPDWFQGVCTWELLTHPSSEVEV